MERFEFYIGGFEIGNAFSELNDPDDQLRRFQAQIEDRKRGDEEAMAEVTPTTSAPWATAFRPPPAKASASTA